jgi:phosphoribosylglycinamide formyltransferase-1
MKNIALFASGGGSNALEIIKHFKGNSKANIQFIVTNNPQAGIINKAKLQGVPVFVFTLDFLCKGDALLSFLNQNNIDWIVLAGYLKKIPDNVIASFPNSIINIHPSILPEFGGKGMHGIAVHKAVISAKKKETGITIHYVNEEYDAGKIIFQITCEVKSEDTPESLAERVLGLEHRYFATTIEKLLDVKSG